MAVLVVGGRNAQASDLLTQMYRQRYRIFVEEKGWKLETQDGLEFDRYDGDHALYLLDFTASGELAASMRMLPTHLPHLLTDTFADMCESGVPRGPHIWELTRGALTKRLRKSGHWGRMQCALVEAALLWGVTTATGVFEYSHIETLMRLGWDGRMLGRPREIDGGMFVACEMPMNAEILARTRAVYKLHAPVIERIFYARDKAVA